MDFLRTLTTHADAQTASKISWSETNRRTFRSLPLGRKIDRTDHACETLFQVACGGDQS